MEHYSHAWRVCCRIKSALDASVKHLLYPFRGVSMRWRSGNSNRFRRRPETMQGQQICPRTGLPQLPLFQAGQCIHLVWCEFLRIQHLQTYPHVLPESPLVNRQLSGDNSVSTVRFILKRTPRISGDATLLIWSSITAIPPRLSYFTEDYCHQLTRYT